MAGLSAIPLAVVCEHGVRKCAGRPRRHLDLQCLPEGAVAVVGRWHDDDESMQEKGYERRGSRARRMLEALGLLWRHRRVLRAARVIHCEEALHYHLLLLLAAARVIRPEGKRIRRAVFRDQAARRIAPLLRRSDPAFQLDYITAEQVRRAARVAGEERIRRHPWRIDTEWFRPGPGGAGGEAEGPLLLAGNMHRDESLVEGLLEEGLRVTRAGRHSGLRKRHEGSLSRGGFELVVNAPHDEYLERLRGASALLLPILACDEPAGLTAAMEALACGVPVLANESMGIAELFAECEYPLPLVGDLSAGAWSRAWRELGERRAEGSLVPGLERARERLLERHGIRPGAGDWQEVLAEH